MRLCVKWVNRLGFFIPPIRVRQFKVNDQNPIFPTTSFIYLLQIYQDLLWYQIRMNQDCLIESPINEKRNGKSHQPTGYIGISPFFFDVHQNESAKPESVILASSGQHRRTERQKDKSAAWSRTRGAHYSKPGPNMKALMDTVRHDHCMFRCLACFKYQFMAGPWTALSSIPALRRLFSNHHCQHKISKHQYTSEQRVLKSMSAVASASRAPSSRCP